MEIILLQNKIYANYSVFFFQILDIAFVFFFCLLVENGSNEKKIVMCAVSTH